jgi:glycosyltransferase involved in cell wall biosynthesis
LVQAVVTFGRKAAKVFFAVGSLVGVLGEVAFQIRTSRFVATLLDRAFQLAELAFVRVDWHTTLSMRDTRRILIVTDAWHPQVNGVVRTLDTTVKKLREWGHNVEVIEPSAYPQSAVPFYPEIRLAWPNPGRLDWRVQQFAPDHIHISTEGPLGRLVRRLCVARGWNFSTSYHTRFPEYLHELARVPVSCSYAALRHFHNRAKCMMVATPSLEAELKSRGFTAPIRRWSRGVDNTLFRPRPKVVGVYPGPVLLYVGRISAEKGVEDFLRINTPGTKVLVGDGPQRGELEHRYPEAQFLGYRRGEALSECYAMADLFVFPSKTDTFGLVVIEALATGLPVAAYPVTGPKDILTHPALGAMHENLGQAITQALTQGEREACLAAASEYTWDRCTTQFLGNLVMLRGG